MKKLSILILLFVMISNGVLAYASSSDTVSTGTRYEQDIDLTTIKTDVITKETIQENGYITLSDILNHAPGISIQRQNSLGNSHQLITQGLSNRTKILINGVASVGDAWQRFGLDQFPASNIEKVEIIRGISAASYGGNNTAGVINIITKKPSRKNKTTTAALIEGDKIVANLFTSQRKNNLAYSIHAQKYNTEGEDYNSDKISDTPNINQSSINGRFFLYDLLGKKSKLTFDVNSVNEFRKAGHIDNWNDASATNVERIRTEETKVRNHY